MSDSVIQYLHVRHVRFVFLYNGWFLQTR